MKTYSFWALLFHLTDNPNKALITLMGSEHANGFRHYRKKTWLDPKEEQAIEKWLFSPSGYISIGNDRWVKIGD